VIARSGERIGRPARWAWLAGLGGGITSTLFGAGGPPYVIYLSQRGLTKEQFESTREYLSKNVFLMTATQDDQLGYALDSQWYGIGEFTSTMRDKLSKLTVADVNRAIKKHFSGQNLSVVIITKDAKDLKDRLTSDAPSTIKYDASKPPELLEEDKVIGVLKLQPTSVTITPVDQVFAK